MTKRRRIVDRHAQDRAPQSTAVKRVSKNDAAGPTQGDDERRLLEALAGYFAILQEWSLKRRPADPGADSYSAQP